MDDIRVNRNNQTRRVPLTARPTSIRFDLSRPNSVSSEPPRHPLQSQKPLGDKKPQKPHKRRVRFYFFKIPLLIRVGAGIVALLMLASSIMPAIQLKGQDDKYDLSKVQNSILTPPRDQYASKLVYDTNAKAYNYNAGYSPSSSGETGGQSSGPKITAQFDATDTKKVTVDDPVNKVSFGITPKFKMGDAKKDSNRIVYPIQNLQAATVFTLGASIIKEDIILHEFQGDKLSFDYDLNLSDGTEARLDKDGSIGVYGVSSVLLGSVTASSDKDQELLNKARQNGAKTQLLFRIPAPFIVEANKDKSNVKAKYELDGKTLTIKVEDLKNASYPLSIDPTVYVENARKLMRGNNETNVDFDIDNELIQKSQTTGARIDDWTGTSSLTSAVWAQGTAAAGGYVYSAGGAGSGTVTTAVYNTAGSSSYNVPSGVTSITVKVWGGGGGGGAGSNGSGVGGNGGGGGYAKASITVTPLETLTVDVGSGGAKGGTNTFGGDGGGYSALRRASTFLVQAGGGGGGGGARGNSNGGTSHGGAGGGSTGVAGNQPTTGGGGGGGGQTGSGGTAGGAASGGGAAGVAGAANAGGNAASLNSANCTTARTGTGGAGGTGGGGDGGLYATNCANGGGGGGGRFGGGGGGSASSNNRAAGGGGGGSSLINATGLISGTDQETQGSGTTPGNNTDSDRANLADGGSGATTTGAASAGDNGIVVISYVTPGGASSSVYWAQFNDTTKAIQSPNPGTGACSGWCTNSSYNLPTALAGHSMIAYNGYLYAIGGRDSSCTVGNGTGTTGTCKTVYVAKLGANGEPSLWHPSGGTAAYWYRAGDLPAERGFGGAIAYNNKMYFLGGVDGTNATSTAVYGADILPNGNLGTWSTSNMQALSAARYGHSVQVYNDVIYLIGGNATYTGSPVNNVYYSRLNSDGSMNSWVLSPYTFTTGRQTGGGSMTTIWGAYLYLSGGCTAVNASGYCTAVATDVQLASVNADGSLAPFDTIIGLPNDRFGYTLLAWQGGLYRLGGCRAQDSITGGCTNTVSDVDYGVINQDGDASTVNNSEPTGSGTCLVGSYTNCDLPPVGDNAGQGGQMSSMVVVNNGFIYVIGGCTTPSSSCNAMSGNTSYSAISSTGALVAPSSCGGTSYGHWCVDSTNRINGTAGVGAGAAAVFNNTIYVVGGTNGGGTWQTNVYYNTVNATTGALGAWTAQTFANLDLDVDSGTGGYQSVGYSYIFTRANPSSASTYPGNLYVLGGCTSNTGIGCRTYYNEVYKCNITTTGPLETADANDCTTSGQLQIDSDDQNSGSQGIGLMAGTIYANRIYLVGGACPVQNQDGDTEDPEDARPCGESYNANRKDTIYARIDNSNNIVVEPGSSNWKFASAQMDPVRRRAVSFGYNGYIYSLAGYSGSESLQDLLFSKIDVSTGDMGPWSSSGVVVTPRWDLRAIVSNGYVYAIGGCATGAAPGGCTDLQEEIQTFQLYNNDSGVPDSFAATGTNCNAASTGPCSGANGVDSIGGSTTIMNNYIYYVRGCSNIGCTTATTNTYYASIDSYGNIGTWFSGGALPAVRAWGKLVNVGGTLYYLGGQDSSGVAQSTVYYSSSISSGNPTWATASASLPAPVTQFGAAVFNNRIYITGGSSSGTVSSTTTKNTVSISPSLASGGNIAAFPGFTTDINITSTADSTGDVGAYSSVGIGGDGLPVIASHDKTTGGAGRLRVTHCNNSTCSSASSSSLDTGNVGDNTTLAIGTDGYPVIAYRDITNNRPKVMKCSTYDCSSNSITTIVDGAASTGVNLNMAIGSDGFPVIAEQNASNNRIRVIKCGDASCSSGNSYNDVQTTITANTNAIAIGSDGFPVISFHKSNATEAIYVAKCGDLTCTSGNATVTSLESGTGYGGLSSIAIGADNNPVVAHYTGSTLRVVKCGNTSCSSGNTATAVDNSTISPGQTNVGAYPSIRVASDGFPIIAYKNSTSSFLKVAKCGNASCSSGNTLTDVDISGSENYGNYASLIIPADGKPIIASYDSNASNLNVRTAKCGNASCSATTSSASSFTVARSGPATVAYASNLYVLGGYNGSNYLQDVQYAHINSDGTLTSWSFSTSLPIPLRDGEAFAANGYMYMVNGRSAASTCNPKTLVAPISANTTIASGNLPTGVGEWYETNVKYAGNRYGGAVSYYRGKLYLTGGGCSAFVNSTTERMFMATLKSQPQVAKYSYMIDTDSDVFPTSWLMNGLDNDIGARWQMRYRSMHDLDALVNPSEDCGTSSTMATMTNYGQETNFGDVTLGKVEQYTPLNSSGGNINCARYFYMAVTIDASQTFGYPEDVTRGPTITDLSLFFTSDPSKRLRHGKTFTGGEKQPLDTPCRVSGGGSEKANCPLP